MNDSIEIKYFSDVLCVWAWIAERRLREIDQEWGDRVSISHHYMDIFSDTANKIPAQWRNRGGYEGFGEHVIKAAAPYENAIVHADVWSRVRPHTSSNAHLLLKAVQLDCGEKVAQGFAYAIRRSFFEQGQDISQTSILLAIADECGIDRKIIETARDNGRAIASLMSDLKSVHKLSIQGSPSWVMNDGRQILYGNVGYRIISANIEELFNSTPAGASWC